MSDRGGGEGRDAVLRRVRAALEGRPRVEHPGPFQGWRPGEGAEEPPTPAGLVERFARMFSAAGGEVARASSEEEAASWLLHFAQGAGAVSLGATVPPEVAVGLGTVAPEAAALGVSMARGAVAETGSVILDARDGRRTQILPPTHVVLVRERDVHATLTDALTSLAGDLPSAIGLHSGPSKSADIGQVLVRGVHGPARVVALVIEGTTSR